MSDREIDPMAAVEYMIAKSGEYAQAKANRIYCEEYRKTLKSELMKEAMGKFDAANAQEREQSHERLVPKAGRTENQRAGPPESVTSAIPQGSSPSDMRRVNGPGKVPCG